MRKITVFIFFLLLPAIVFAQDSGKKKAYYFYGEQCPHCKNVDEYFQANGIYDKYNITKLEFSNPFNARLLMKFGEKFNSEYKGSVPAVAFADKFMVGDQPIIDSFVSEIDAAEIADELPNPDKNENVAADTSGQENQESQTVQSQSGNKKNIFPVVLIALMIAGGGALVWVNRNKTKE